MAVPVVLDAPYLRVSDLIDLSAFEDSADPAVLARLSQTPVITLEAGKVVELSSRDIADALEARIPGLAGQLGLRDERTRAFVHRPHAPRAAPACLRLLTDLQAGDVIRRSDAEQSESCEGAIGRNALLSTGASIKAREALPSSTVLPLASRDLLPIRVRGDELTLVSTFGPVTISRPVELMRTLDRPGDALVKTSDGRILRAELGDAEFDDGEPASTSRPTKATP